MTKLSRPDPYQALDPINLGDLAILEQVANQFFNKLQTIKDAVRQIGYQEGERPNRHEHGDQLSGTHPASLSLFPAPIVKEAARAA